MYRWPNGRVIRIICLILTAAITTDFAFAAYGQIGSYLAAVGGGATRQIILGGVFSAIALGVVIFGLVAVGFHSRYVDFLIDVETEMTRVEWPAPNALVRSTIIIAIAVAIMAGIILIVDFAFTEVLTKQLPALGASLRSP